MNTTFSAVCECPRCGTTAVHQMRPPNPDPPIKLAEPDIIAFSEWGGGVVRDEVVKHYDRWDERPYEIIRTCKCGKEWGQQ